MFIDSIVGVGDWLHIVLEQIDSELWLPWQLKGPTDLNGENVVRAVALSVLMAPSNLQVQYLWQA